MIKVCSIELFNFRNTEYGKIAFPGSEKGADVIGLYGQNGSGKTSIIDALAIAKALLSGRPLPEFSADCISCKSRSFKIAIQFHWTGEDAEWLIDYGVECKQSRMNDDFFISLETLHYKDILDDSHRKTLLIKHETVEIPSKASGRYPDSSIGSMESIIDQSSLLARVIGREGAPSVQFNLSPRGHWDSLLSSSGDVKSSLTVSEQTSYEKKRSFIFSGSIVRAGEVLNDLREKDVLSRSAQEAFVNMLIPLQLSILQLMLYALLDLEIVTTKHGFGLSIDLLSIATRQMDPENRKFTDINLNINEPTVIDESTHVALCNTIEFINAVLPSIIPSLSLVVNDLGVETAKDGSQGVRVEILSSRGEKRLPFRCESEGVKKIVTIMSYLIDVYSKKGVCVAIDELDSGIFEYLLGEILEVLSDHGKGQLIFTAHNLRPLEVLDPKSVVFTTTNPKNRYIRFSTVKSSNNLRNLFFRAIELGGQAEPLYEPTSKYEIESAFYDASVQANRNGSDRNDERAGR